MSEQDFEVKDLDIVEKVDLGDSVTREFPDIVNLWMSHMGLQVGVTVMIIPVGSIGNGGFQGVLETVIFGENEPAAIIIKNNGEGAPVTIRWGAVAMITTVAPEPQVDLDAQAAAIKQIQDDFEAKVGQSLVQYADENGLALGADGTLDAGPIEGGYPIL